MHQANDEGYELVQETGVSEETGFHEGRGRPWEGAPMFYGNTLMRYIAGNGKDLCVLQARGRRSIGIHGIRFIEDY